MAARWEFERVAGVGYVSNVSARLPHERASVCDCGDAACRPSLRLQEAGRKSSGGVVAAAAPLLACLFCPACLSLWAKLGGALGAGMAIGEAAHGVVLAAALFVSTVASLWRYRGTGRKGPLAAALLGTLLLAAAHLLGEVTALEIAGMAILIGGVVLDRWGGATAVAPANPR